MATCIRCGTSLSPTFRLCPQCGTAVVSLNPLPAQTLSPPQNSALYSGPVPGGFWRRAVAFLLDLLILVPLSLLVQSNVLPFLGGLVAWWLYYVLFETSKWQATPGKRALGLKVTDVNGVHIRFGRATGRFFAKPLSGAILGIGFVMAAFTKHKQALHDLLAGTLVLKRT